MFNRGPSISRIRDLIDGTSNVFMLGERRAEECRFGGAFNANFSIAYIYHHSNRDLPAPYKFATLWSGQEGSLLFWSLLLSGYGLVLRLRHKTDVRLFAHASVVADHHRVPAA